MKEQSSSHSHTSENTITRWHTCIKLLCLKRIGGWSRCFPVQIAEAQEAILGRVRELFSVETDHIEEDQILDDA